MADRVGNSPAGVIEEVPNLAYRQRSIYWRPLSQPNGSILWQQTGLLPSDNVGKEQYLSKGFRLDNPNEPAKEQVPEVDSEKERLYAEIAQLRQELDQKVLQEEASPLYVSDKPPKKKRKARKKS